MRTSSQRRFEIEIGLGAACLVLLALTAVWPDWIEEVFRVDPDGGDGSLEWALVALLAVLTIAFSWHGVRGLRAAAASSSSETS